MNFRTKQRQEYTVEGQPHIKSIDKDGKVIDEGIAKDKDGKEAYASKTFVAEATTQKIELVFNVDTRELQGKSLVAFEKLLPNVAVKPLALAMGI